MAREPFVDGLDQLLDLQLAKIGYDSGYWVTIRVVKIAPDAGRPFGHQYAPTLHDHNDDRVRGVDNSHDEKLGIFSCG